MPVISKFYGIVIRMLVIRPFVAHFHAIYGNCELIVGVAPLRVIQGDAPSRVRAMVLEWAAQHQGELLEAWNRLSAAQSPLPIAPLR
ncbi:MAG: transcriptional regulator [Verrucomicrobia bacterium]|nr:MAG: transcriptional regulator [Verrucomicrobiota bacterium]PYK63228.1 MAG: transcriptional regulator [Verrucomicrobiota bacterium]